MGSGRGDRNQLARDLADTPDPALLQWGPVVVTGIRLKALGDDLLRYELQWGPVVVTGISSTQLP